MARAHDEGPLQPMEGIVCLWATAVLSLIVPVVSAAALRAAPGGGAEGVAVIRAATLVFLVCGVWMFFRLTAFSSERLYHVACAGYGLALVGMFVREMVTAEFAAAAEVYQGLALLSVVLFGVEAIPQRTWDALERRVEQATAGLRGEV